MACKTYLIGLVVLLEVSSSFGNFIGKDSIGKHVEYLDVNGQYLVEWEAYKDTKTIIFELTAATRGFVGFGISPAGGMTGADIIIGGVHPNGTVYFGNYHATKTGAPDVDEHETWELIEAIENSTHTYLKVGRFWNTCDSQDVAIENNTNHFIWALGENDNVGYHGNTRGTSTTIILDPPMPPLDTSEFHSWKMIQTMDMPEEDTTYWCTVQKNPPLLTKHHIVGFSPILSTPLALRHTHHFIIRRCKAPQGSTDEEFFERFIGQAGDECYNGSPHVPLRHCEGYLYIWAAGGKTTVYPDFTGFPVAVNGSTNYFLFEIHYDNPNKLKGFRFETGVQIFYTPKLRKYDTGFFAVGQTPNYALTIPPKSEAHMIVGHCAPSCSNRIPETGITVLHVMLHSHLAGRKMKLRHYRNGIELPWISSDDSYDFNYQQNRPLLEEVKILPGDQLTCECTYNTMDRNDTVTGGLSTRQEMCFSNVIYYPDIGWDTCMSNLVTTDLLKEFGIERFQGSASNPTITAPETMANKTYIEVLDTMIPWTMEFRNHVQNLMRYGDHVTVCSLAHHSETIKYYDTSKEYVPLNECENRENPDSPGGESKQTLTQSSLYLMAGMLAILSLQLWI